jgi:hypothetical protein
MFALDFTATPLDPYSEAIARWFRRALRRPAHRRPVGAACVMSSPDALIGRLVAQITRGNRWVAVGRVPRTRSRRVHDAAMQAQYGDHGADLWGAWSTLPDRRAHYLRHGSRYVVVADHPFTLPTGIVAADVSEFPVGLGEYWITAERRGGHWVGQVQMDLWPNESGAQLAKPTPHPTLSIASSN